MKLRDIIKPDNFILPNKSFISIIKSDTIRDYFLDKEIIEFPNLEDDRTLELAPGSQYDDGRKYIYNMSFNVILEPDELHQFAVEHFDCIDRDIKLTIKKTIIRDDIIENEAKFIQDQIDMLLDKGIECEGFMVVIENNSNNY